MPRGVSEGARVRPDRWNSEDRQQENWIYPSGESLIRKRVRTCSDISSIAERLRTGSAWARYFMASTNSRWPSTYRGSEVRSRRLLPNFGGTVIVKTLAMNTSLQMSGQYSARYAAAGTISSPLHSTT